MEVIYNVQASLNTFSTIKKQLEGPNSIVDCYSRLVRCLKHHTKLYKALTLVTIMDHFQLHKQMILFFLSGAIPISPAIYGGTPAPVLFDSPSCVQQFGFVNQRFVRIGGLPERLIDCGFINVVGSPPIARVNILIGPQQVVTSQTRLVGVRCDGKDGHISCRHVYINIICTCITRPASSVHSQCT